MKLTFRNLNDLAGRILDNIGAGVYLVDADRIITDWNRGCELLTGYQAQEVVGKDCAEIMQEADDQGTDICANRCPMRQAFEQGRSIECASPGVSFCHKSGRRVATHSTVSPILDDQGNVIGGMKLFLDVSEERELQRRIQFQADTDELTGLHNRRVCHERLQAECRRAARYERPLCLLFLDMDDFKNFNDSYGHNEGDKALVELARILRESLRDSDMPFRWGGEEFLVILPETDAEDAVRVAEKTRTMFEAVELRPGGQSGSSEAVHQTVSIGVAAYRSETTPFEFVHMADDAMYRAKGAGKNCTRLFQ